MAKEVDMENVIGNNLLDLDKISSEDKGYDALTRSTDMLLKHSEERDRIINEDAIANRKLDIEERKLEIERDKIALDREKFEADNAAREREAKLKEVENKAVIYGTSVTLGLGLGRLAYDVWGLCKVGKFEQSGVWRSLASKIATGKIGRK